MKKEFISACFALGACAAFAAIELGAPFSDGVVLQRGMKVPVWGKIVSSCGKAAREVKVEFAGQVKKASVGADGSWRVDLDAMEASSESRTMKVCEIESGFFFDSVVDSVEVKDVLVGEVWFASGQSNMETPIWHDANSRYRDGKGAMMTSMTRMPLVRYVKTPRIYGTPGRNKLKVQWCRFEPSSFIAPVNSVHWKLPSAVAWYFARELHIALGVPVGIVDSSIGGTNIDAWTPREGYEGCDASIKATADYMPKFGKDWTKDCVKGVIGAAFQQPTALFNAMVWDYAPMAMRGFIWYQGCHNADESELYSAKMHALYNGWSKVFENPNLKLYFAQLAPWKHNWMGICMAQDKFVSEQPNAAIAVTSDVGNFDDIHPNDKETVAQRLVIHALKRDYGFDIPEDCSPTAKSLSVSGDVATVTFDHVKTWYVYNENMKLDAPFEVAGDDGVWEAAELVDYGKTFKDWRTFGLIDKPQLSLRSDKVKKPVKARYLGKERTKGVMYNQASLPLGPFEISVR